MFDAKTITQAPGKSTAKKRAGKKPTLSAKHVKMIEDALAKHAANKPKVTISIHTPSTYLDEDEKREKKELAETDEDD